MSERFGLDVTTSAAALPVWAFDGRVSASVCKLYMLEFPWSGIPVAVVQPNVRIFKPSGHVYISGNRAWLLEFCPKLRS